MWLASSYHVWTVQKGTLLFPQKVLLDSAVLKDVQRQPGRLRENLYNLRILNRLKLSFP